MGGVRRGQPKAPGMQRATHRKIGPECREAKVRELSGFRLPGPRRFVQRFDEASPPDLPTTPRIRADSGRHKGGSSGRIGNPCERRSRGAPRTPIATCDALPADGCHQLPMVENSAPTCVSDRRATSSLVIGVDVCQYQRGPQRGSDVQGESRERTFVPAAAVVSHVPGAGASRHSG